MRKERKIEPRTILPVAELILPKIASKPPSSIKASLRFKISFRGSMLHIQQVDTTGMVFSAVGPMLGNRLRQKILESSHSQGSVDTGLWLLSNFFKKIIDLMTGVGCCFLYVPIALCKFSVGIHFIANVFYDGNVALV